MKNAEAVLSEVERKHGALTPGALVREASEPSHPWHYRFDWDDASAAHAHRLDQARVFIRQVRFNVVTETQVFRSVSYVRNPNLDSWEQGYVKIVELKTDRERATSALLAEFDRVAALLKRSRDIAGTLGLSQEINRFIIDIEGLAGMVRQRKRPAAGPRVAA